MSCLRDMATLDSKDTVIHDLARTFSVAVGV